MAAAPPAQGSPASVAQGWIEELGTSEASQSKWLTRSRKIQRKYKAERSERDSKRRYQMLWSNTQTILPAAYSRPPEPVVSRRFKDSDPVGRAASEIIERSLSFSIDDQDLDGVLKACALDFVLLARGQTWERYVPTYGPVETVKKPVLQVTTDAGVCYTDDDKEVDPEAVQEDGRGGHYIEDSYRPVIFEQSITDYVSFEDFGHTPARVWSEVWYVWRRVFMSRQQLVERFGKKVGNAVPLDYPAKRSGDREEVDFSRRAAIYEIWDKNARKAFWISKSYPDAPLDERPDPLKLDGFFPCPRPLLGTVANDTLLPTPDYVYYQDQAEEIDTLTAKIGELQEMLKVAGLYAGEGKQDLNALFKAANSLFIPVQEWQGLQDAGGVSGRIEWWPIEKVTAALTACIGLRAQLIEDVYQITGVSDILRGASDPRETLGAQNLKSQWGALRIRDRQKELARFARDIMRLKGEVIAGHFAPETLAAMTGVKLPTGQEKAQAELKAAQAQRMQQPVPPQVAELLQTPSWDDVTAMMRDVGTRQFRVDIETDSTIEPDEQQEKAQTVEFLGAIGQMVQTWGPAIQQAPQLAPMASAFIKWGARRFRAGRELETMIDQTMDQMAAGAAAPQQGAPAEPPPDQTPVQVAQINLQREQVKQQGETQRAELDAQIQGADQTLRQGDQQLKVVALQRDPDPQAAA